MKNLLIGYTTLVAFIVITMLSAMVLPAYQPNTQAATSIGKTQTPSCWKWVFDARKHNEVITNLWSPATGSLNATYATLSHTNNIKPQGDYVDPYKVLDIRVVDPYINENTPDLRVGTGKVLIMNGGKLYRVSDTGNNYPHRAYANADSTFSRDNHDGGNLTINFNGSNVTQIKFDAIDIGDELDGKGRINNNYYTVTTADGKTEKVGMNTHDGSNLPDKFVWKVSTRDYGQNISKITIHYSGSAAVDNLEFCNLVKPTYTPPVIPTTIVPTTVVPTTIVPTTVVPTTITPKVCKQWTTQRFYSGEFNASKPDQRNFNLGTVEFTNVAKKYPIKVRTLWGWTGATENNPQIGDAFHPRVQNEEDHTVTFKYIDNQSSATKNLSMKCEDLGNTKSWNDGVELQDIDDPKSEYNKFKYCRQNITSEVNDGSPRSLDYIYLEGKYDKIQINSKLDMTPSEYATCVDKYSARKCNQSHYSLVEVVTCAKEG